MPFANKAEERAYHREWERKRWQDPGYRAKKRASGRAYYWRNAERMRERVKQYHLAHIKEHTARITKFRKMLKLKVVIALGGKCAICGYAKCLSAFDLHHINPAEKERERDWRIKANGDKIKHLQLLCRNCHAELHHPERLDSLVGNMDIRKED